MLIEGLDRSLLAALQRPDLRIVAGARRIRFTPTLARSFVVAPDGAVSLGPEAIGSPRLAAFHLRHALELSLLVADEDGRPTGIRPVMGRLAAARVAARFWELDAEPGDGAGLPGWVGALGQATAPDRADARDWLGMLADAFGGGGFGPGGAGVLNGDELARLAASWEMLGPVELLLGSGGDARLVVAAESRLNHYGCSHRPRPWAVTYASSTASSLSERGFAGAEAARVRLLRDALGGRAGASPAAESDTVRAAIASHYGLPAGTGIVLTASGTDSELLALAIAAAPGGDRATGLVNILTAPDETGSGVPLAAIGRHFASDTARGARVDKGQPVVGMPGIVQREDVAIRRSDGSLIAAETVDRTAEAIADAARAAGRRVLLHLLDVSKTGLLAPSVECVARIARAGRGAVDVVVDACQARLTAARVRSYVKVGWLVLITGSKFFTGPPFCGALLVPERMMRRLRDGRLPEGLADYCGRPDWPAEAAAADGMPATVNAGMVLRWQAAVEEMRAFAAVPGERKRTTLAGFVEAVRGAIDANPDLQRIAVPPLRRPTLGDEAPAWDELQTIVAFTVRDPAGGVLGLEPARQLYRWLNADLGPFLPAGIGAHDRFLASLRCHVGQPAPVADGSGGVAGALRISAGARLVSGEPSHAGIGHEARVAREIADARACLDKLSLALRHLDVLRTADPEPSYGSAG